MTLRIILDTNAFHGVNFDALENGPFLRLCQQKKLFSVVPHTVAEETFNAYARADRRRDLVTRWLPLITKSASTFSEDLPVIWHEELIRGRGKNARRTMHASDYEALKRRIVGIPINGDWGLWHATTEEREGERVKQKAQRSLSSEIRREIRKEYEDHPEWERLVKEANWRAHIVKCSELFGCDFIRKKVRCWDPAAVANRWLANKRAYPFYSQFAENIAYMFLHAMLKQNDRIDSNAQTDLDIMTHLLHADIFVTNETRFARAAFMDIWKPRGKVLMTSPEFESFICKL
jgi:hypothetical protein